MALGHLGINSSFIRTWVERDWVPKSLFRARRRERQAVLDPPLLTSKPRSIMPGSRMSLANRARQIVAYGALREVQNARHVSNRVAIRRHPQHISLAL